MSHPNYGQLLWCWLIQQGIPNPQDVTLQPLVIPGKQNTSDSDIHKIMEKGDITTGSLDKVRDMVSSDSGFLMKFSNYILSDDDIDQCQKRVEWLKNIIWLIGNKPTENKMKEDLPLDNLKFEMEGISNNDGEQEHSKETVTDESKIATESKDSENVDKTVKENTLHETKVDKTKGNDKVMTQKLQLKIKKTKKVKTNRKLRKRTMWMKQKGTKQKVLINRVMTWKLQLKLKETKKVKTNRKLRKKTVWMKQKFMKQKVMITN